MFGVGQSDVIRSIGKEVILVEGVPVDTEVIGEIIEGIIVLQHGFMGSDLSFEESFSEECIGEDCLDDCIADGGEGIVVVILGVLSCIGPVDLYAAHGIGKITDVPESETDDPF